MNKVTQYDKMMLLLIKYRYQWVSCVEILKLNIAQYNRVIKDLRDGKTKYGICCIDNKTETIEGQKQSWFRLWTYEKSTVNSEEIKQENIQTELF